MLRYATSVLLIILSVQLGIARELDTAEKKIIAEAVVKDFKDGPAARFRWLPIKEASGISSQTYCGMVNGKNSFGAYSGFGPFAVFLATKDDRVIVAALLSVENPNQSAVLQTCAAQGIDPTKAQ